MKDPLAGERHASPRPHGSGGAIVILNPEAGCGWKPDEVGEAVRASLPGAELAVTTGPGDAIRVAARAAASGATLVVAAGGDGLIGEVVDGLLGEVVEDGLIGRDRVPRLGILPLGTGNDLARSLGIPRRLEPAVRVLLDGELRPLDAGEMMPDGPAEEAPARRFVNVVVAGFGARIRLRSATKRRWKGASYLREALAQLPDLRRHRVSVHLEGDAGEERFDGEALMVVVANGGRMGAGIEVAPAADLQDGLLDVVVVPVLGPARLARTLASVTLRRRLPPELAWSRRARAVRVEGDPPLWLNADGEVFAPRPTIFRSLPAALRVIVPGSVSGS